ncbi:membrane protease subunit HflK [Rhodobium orientis]|uniref:Protein HflK n=1 Tax=Rhodobium orientis TaxID=34017 RepID=A0A327JH39_9HYPH|nr:FtsH protease activity modulator HflK [Rhodobium orientis]MBB4305385.1 membrane protease subunit HflK [Rhodobium orientis]MBK5950081.1 HflK protein [Rhodobium orientis]RAI25251.1 FtsH protease activity modulator HflK [Rhodobium orientis]
MPWSNQSGGGGNGPWGSGGGGGGPWGSGPQRGGGGGGQPPDLEELLRRTQEKLKSSLPGGGSTPLIAGLIAVAVVAIWLFQSIYTVQPDELGVELVFGKPKQEFNQQGIHFHWWPVETVEIVKIIENKEEIGVGRGRERGSTSSSLMLSGDQNIVNVEFSVLWKVADPGKYLFNVRDPHSLIRSIAESAMREVVGRRPAEDVFRKDRQGIEDAVRAQMQTSLDAYGAGVDIAGIKLEAADPPAEVADAFEEVQRAEQDEDRFKREADAYANQRLGEARGQAAQIQEEAKGYKDRVTKEAEGEAQRFVSVYQEYDKAKDVTKRRLYLETMERVLKSSNKVIVEDKAGSGVVPYLPLTEVDRSRRDGARQGGN